MPNFTVGDRYPFDTYPIIDRLDGTELLPIVNKGTLDLYAPLSAIAGYTGITSSATAFGAIADGTDHLLSERFTTLAEAQAVYPRATSLSQSIDAMAIQAATDAVGATGVAGKVFLGDGSYVVNNLSTIFIQFNNITIDGGGAEVVATDCNFPVFASVDPTDPLVHADNLTYRNIRFRQTVAQYDVNNNGIFGSNPLYPQQFKQSCAIFHHGLGSNATIKDCSFYNFVNALSYYGDWSDASVAGDGLTILNVSLDTNNFGFWINGANDVFIDDIRNAHTQFVQIAAGVNLPPHVIYCIGGAGFENISTRWMIRGIKDYDTTHGSTVKLKSVTNFVVDGVESDTVPMAVDCYNCSNGSILGINLINQTDDTAVTLSQAGVMLLGCSDVIIDSPHMDCAAQNASGIVINSLDNAAYSTPPATNTPSTRITVIGPTIHYRPSASPLYPVYINGSVDVTILRPHIDRASGHNQWLIGVYNVDADNVTTNIRILDPSIRADSTDTYKNMFVYVRAGVINTIVSYDILNLLNVDTTAADFYLDNGTGTILRPVLGDGGVARQRLDVIKSASGRAWSPLSTVAGLFETTAGALVNLVGNDTSVSGIRISTASTDGGAALTYDNSSTTWTLRRNGSNQFTFSSGGIRPGTNDGAALGSATLSFSDLFLASGAVVGFDNGDVTLTHSADLLTLAGGNLTVPELNATTTTVSNAGLHILDTNASHDLIIAPGSDLTADHTLTLTTGDADRTVTLNGNPTLNDWFDQSVKTTDNPSFAQIRATADTGGVASTTTLTNGSDVTANSTGVGTIAFKGATSRDSTGFIKIYVGTTAYYIPIFSAITG